MPLNHLQIIDRLNDGLIYNAQDIAGLHKEGVILEYANRAVNPASLDIHLGKTVLVERYNEKRRPVSYRRRERISMDEIDISKKPYVLRPGEFILGHSIEVFDFPNDLSAILRTKSSQGRTGLEHLDAGWVDPGFAGSLTLEYKSMVQFSDIELQYGDPVGQLIFFPIDELPPSLSYRSVGRYGGHSSVEQIK